MMVKIPSVDDMFSGKESRYALVVAVAKRAREITLDCELRGEVLSENAVKMAEQDFKHHLYVISGE
ncbi:MAG: DNA-directed RNA polymerase subunit omega [Oscillospiraceae bacterium]|jgi:DNA-directed RNA polymerase subunit omega|nr:DNA-directed RNA polymerase subunit omega [Oscillospiraceae bacterium]